jgi:hypothetical protein
MSALNIGFPIPKFIVHDPDRLRQLIQTGLGGEAYLVPRVGQKCIVRDIVIFNNLLPSHFYKLHLVCYILRYTLW